MTTWGVRGWWWACVVGLAALPWAMSAALLQRSNATWADIMPFSDFSSYMYLTDELYYWHQAGSFRVAGLNAGQYSIAEQPAPATWTPYYSWGPFVPAFYGVLSHLFGWAENSMVIYNLALLSLGFVVFCVVTRPKWLDLVLLGGVVAVFSPLILFHPISMLPVMELAMALMVGAALHWHLRCHDKRSLVVVIGLIVALSTLRTAWVLALLPLMAVRAWPHPRRLVAALGLGCLLVAGGWWLYGMTAAPYPSPLTQTFETLSQDVGAALTIMADNAAMNWKHLTHGHRPERHFTWSLVALIAVLTVALAWWTWRLRKPFLPYGEALDQQQVRAFGFSWAALLLTLTAGLVLYDLGDWRGFRLMAPLALLPLALAAAYGQRWLMLGAICVCVLGLPDVRTQHYDHLRAKLSPSQAQTYRYWRDAFSTVLQYDPAAPTRWCNTVYFHVGYFNEGAVLAALPHGLGLSFFFNDTGAPVKSRWLILNAHDAAHFQQRHALAHVIDLPQGALYRNLDSACDLNQPPEVASSG